MSGYPNTVILSLISDEFYNSTKLLQLNLFYFLTVSVSWSFEQVWCMQPDQWSKHSLGIWWSFCQEPRTLQMNNYLSLVSLLLTSEMICLPIIFLVGLILLSLNLLSYTSSSELNFVPVRPLTSISGGHIRYFSVLDLSSDCQFLYRICPHISWNCTGYIQQNTEYVRKITFTQKISASALCTPWPYTKVRGSISTPAYCQKLGFHQMYTANVAIFIRKKRIRRVKSL